MTKLLRNAYHQVLKIDRVRFAYCKLRWMLNRRNLRFAPHISDDVGAETIKHNLSAFDDHAVFGMAKRMALLLFPIAALLRGKDDARVLIVGPRTEDDIFWAKSLGIENTLGFDLFSYSRHVVVGDIHGTEFGDASFDAVLLGWVVSYSKKPQRIVAECTRILKPGGFLAFGIEVDSNQARNGIRPPRVNTVNSADDIEALGHLKRIFVAEPDPGQGGECGIVLRKPLSVAAAG